jgi:hypothetical protein
VLVFERLVAEATRDEAALGGLLPVVVAVPRVVRADEQAPLQRLGDEYLAARRPDCRVELRHQPFGVAVGRDHEVVGLERVERLDPLVLAELGARVECSRRQTPDPARRLKRPIRRMEDRAVEAPGEGLGELATPLDRKAVRAQRLVLGFELRSFSGIRGQAKAARPSKGVAGQLLEPVEVALRERPEGLGLPCPQPSARHVICGCTTAQGEATVAPARATRDLAGFNEAHALAGLGEPESARTASHAAADDRHVDRSRRTAG